MSIMTEYQLPFDGFTQNERTRRKADQFLEARDTHARHPNVMYDDDRKKRKIHPFSAIDIHVSPSGNQTLTTSYVQGATRCSDA
jgi:hypothetical protein